MGSNLASSISAEAPELGPFPNNITVTSPTRAISATEQSANGHGLVQGLNKRSCIECRRRKTRCDKRYPCSRCTKTSKQCVFPHSGRARKINGSTEAELTSRLRRLEGIVQKLGVNIEGDQENEAAHEPREANDDQEHAEISSQRSAAMLNGESGVGWNRLVDELGKYRYVNSEHWKNLCHEVEDLKRLEHVWFEEEERANESDTSSKSMTSVYTPQYDACFLFRLSSLSSDLLMMHPTQGQIFLLWQIYLENVDPLLKIFHRPTVQRLILEASQDMAALSRENEALLFAVYYGAVMSMQQDECQTLLKNDKIILSSKYRFGTEQALARAGFLETRNLTVLQAFVLFLICARQDRNVSSVWTFTGLVIRIAYRLDLNRDPTELENCPPYEVEMRRRLWWHICILDTLTAQTSGRDPSIFQQTFNTKFPSNLNDSDLDRHMSEMPTVHQGRTEMLFCLVRFETSYALRKSVFSEKFSKDNLYPIMNLEEKIKYMDNLEEQLENKYLKYCDMTIPLSFVTATYTRLVMAKMKLVLRRLLEKGSQSNAAELSAYVFTKAVNVVDYSHTLRSACGAKKWVWLFGTFLEREVLAFLVSALCLHTKGRAVDRAWRIVNRVFADVDEAPLDGKMKRLQKQTIRLFAKARTAREDAIQQQLAESPPDALVAVETSNSALQGCSSTSEPEQFDSLLPTPCIPNIHPPDLWATQHTPQDDQMHDTQMPDESAPIITSAPQLNPPILSPNLRDSLGWATWDTLIGDFPLDVEPNGDEVGDLNTEMGGDLGLGDFGDWNPGAW